MQTRIASGCAFLAVAALSAGASVFQLELKPGSRVYAGRITVHAALANRGDEDMLNVQAAVRFEGVTNTGPILAELRPGESTEVDLDAGPVPAIGGQYTAVVTTRYTDRYGHPFMSLEPIAVYTAEPADTPALSATLSRMTLGDEAPLSLALSSQVSDNITVRCHLMLPDELECSALTQTVALPGRGSHQVTFDVARTWATDNSQYRVYAVVNAIHAGRHESLAAPGLVTVPARQPLSPTTIKRLWLIPGALLVAYLLAQLLPRRRNLITDH